MLILTIAIKDQVELRLSLVCGTLGALNSEATILYYITFRSQDYFVGAFLGKRRIERFLNCRLSANFVINTMRERMRGSKGCFGIINANSFDDA